MGKDCSGENDGIRQFLRNDNKNASEDRKSFGSIYYINV